MDEDWTEADDIIEEVRAIRRRIWERFDNDPKKLVAHYVEHDKHYKGPVIDLPDQANEGEFAT